MLHFYSGRKTVPIAFPFPRTWSAAKFETAPIDERRRWRFQVYICRVTDRRRETKSRRRQIVF